MKHVRETISARKDARRAKGPDEPKRMPAKKDTRRWCRGKVGVEHSPKCFDYRESKNAWAGFRWPIAEGWKILACTACGKELDRYYPFAKSKLPEWAQEQSK